MVSGMRQEALEGEHGPGSKWGGERAPARELVGRGEGTCPNGGFEGRGPREGAAPVHPHTRWGGRPRRGSTALRGQDAEPAAGPAVGGAGKEALEDTLPRAGGQQVLPEAPWDLPRR